MSARPRTAARGPRRSGAGARRNPRRRPPRRGFHLLLLVLVGLLAWTAVARSGMLHRARPEASPAGRIEKARPLGALRPPTASEREAVDRLAALGLPLRCGAGTKRLVALTFDDGPGPLTDRALAVLRRFGAPATFFLVGKELDAWPQLHDMPAKELAAGALGDHTWDHVSLPGLTAGRLFHQIHDTAEAIERSAGEPVQLFRPPYGAHDARVDAEARALGMLQVLWSLESGDSNAGTTARDVYRAVADGVRPGAIVLFHENRGTTLRALPRILAMLRSRHYRAVSIPQLVAQDPPSEEQLRAGSCP